MRPFLSALSVLILSLLSSFGSVRTQIHHGVEASYAVNGQSASLLLDIHFANDTAGWVVGDSGVIGHWVPANEEWVSQTSGTQEKLRSVHFPAVDTGWAVGDSGIVLHTEDGGTNWSVQATPDTMDLYGVHFTDTDSGWAVGDSGTVLRTGDGGSNWTLQASGTAKGLKAVEFENSSVGHAVGDSGITLRTTDGGSNWNLGAFAPDTLYDLSFVNDTLGWAVGGKESIVRTDDGGGNWIVEQDTANSSFNLYSVQMLDSLSGTAFGEDWTGYFYNSGYWFLEAAVEFANTRSHHFFSQDTGWTIKSWNGTDSIYYFTDADSTTYFSIQENEGSSMQLELRPNPFRERTHFVFQGPEIPHSLSLYTPEGRKVRSQKLPQQQRVPFHRKGLSRGVYIYVFRDEEGRLLGRGKLVVR